MASRISASARAALAACSAPRYSSRAQVAEQHEALRRIAFQHLRAVQPGLADGLRHLHEGAHVFLRRRRVHDDQAAVRRA